MLEKIKKSLRINNNLYDDEIEGLIKSCIIELKLSGVASSLFDEPDEFIERAIIVYCKANFGFDNPDSEKFLKSFESLKVYLALNYNHSSFQQMEL